MGYDGHLCLWDVSERVRLLRSREERLGALRTELADPPEWLVSEHRRFERRVEHLDAFDSGGTNESLAELYLTLAGWVNFRPDSIDYLWLTNRRSSTVLNVFVPEFLGERSDRAERLWRRLVGQADEYEVAFDGTQFRFEPGMAGYLTNEERRELADELGPILPETGELYAAIDEHYDASDPPVPAREMAIVECVRALCLASPGKGLFYYHS